MAIRNNNVQQRLFQRINMLMSIEGAERQMAESLIEVFTNNKQTCLKINHSHIKRIFELIVKHKANVPQFMELLASIIKVLASSFSPLRIILLSPFQINFIKKR